MDRQCEKCAQPLPSGRKWGLCAACRQLCPRCGLSVGQRASPGYCPDCQREKRREANGALNSPGRLKKETDPTLKKGQIWYPNPQPHSRLPVQQITLDLDRTLQVLQTFFTAEELEVLTDRLTRLVQDRRERSDEQTQDEGGAC